MTKEEKIKEAWINSIGIEGYDFLTNNGYLRNKNGYIDGEYAPLNHFRKQLYHSNNIDIILVDEAQFIRPKSLHGIENNNGWIKIESEEDLPKESNGYWVKGNNNISGIIHFENTPSWIKLWNDVTHYQPIEKPKHPVY